MFDNNEDDFIPTKKFETLKLLNYLIMKQDIAL